MLKHLFNPKITLLYPIYTIFLYLYTLIYIIIHNHTRIHIRSCIHNHPPHPPHPPHTRPHVHPRTRTRPKPKGEAWATLTPSVATLGENTRLRDLLSAEKETGVAATLNPEERERAELLLARSLRKKDKRAVYYQSVWDAKAALLV
jgi:hypothetical protein